MYMAYTPAIQQYVDIKSQHKDCILFFRLGDFYEVFFEDAKTCSKVLDLVLTSKNKNAGETIQAHRFLYEISRTDGNTKTVNGNMT